MRIDATAEALEFITANGGKVYVWVDDVGFGHASPKRPPPPLEFAEYPAAGFTFFQDTEIVAPDWWKIEFHHLPHHHVTATWDGGRYGVAGSQGMIA